MAFKFLWWGRGTQPAGFGTSTGGVSPEVDDKAGAVISPQEMFDKGGIAARIVNCIAEEMTRTGFTLQGIPDVQEKKVTDLMKATGFDDLLTRAIREANISGGSLIFFGLSGSPDLLKPAPATADILFLKVISKESVTVLQRYGRENVRKIGEPEILQLHFMDGNTLDVHESRCAIFLGAPASEDKRQQNEGWGNSLIDVCRDEINNYESGLKWANRSLERNHQGVIKVPDLGKSIKEAAGRNLMRKRLEKIDLFRGPTNTLAIDSLEEYSLNSTSLAGVADILDRDSQALSAASGIPQKVLLGDASEGLGSSGQSDLEIWYGRVGQGQKGQNAPCIAMFCRFTIGTTPDIVFNPLHIASDKEQAETDKTEAETAQIYWEMDSLSSGEVREVIADKYNINPRVRINNGGKEDPPGKKADKTEEEKEVEKV